MSKMFLFNEKALRSIAKGIQTLAKAVKVTLGPKGRNVIIKKDHFSFFSTRDGVSVAEEIFLKDKFENMGAQIVKQVAKQTSDIAGDGTTTAIVLAEEMFLETIKNIIAHSNFTLIKNGVKKAVRVVCDKLDNMAIKISSSKEVKQIATVSANNDEEIGSIISEAIEKVGRDGIISIEESNNMETSLKMADGMQLDSGFMSPYFITDSEKMLVEMENPLIFITDKKLTSPQDVVKILEKVMEKEARPFLIIAEDIDSDALSTLVINKVKANLPICAVKAPAFGDVKKEILKDIAILTNAEVITEEKGYDFDNFDLNFLGQAKKIRISKKDTTIINGLGASEEIKKRSSLIKASMLRANDYEKEKLEKRLANLNEKAAVIYLGAATEIEMKEKKQRVEDALSATKAAMLEGIVPGGGVALLRTIESLDSLENLSFEDKLGVQIVKKAILAPAVNIARNCGENGDIIAHKIIEKKGAWGYNGLTNKFSDLVSDGVIDPVLVTKTALVNAESIVMLLSSISVLVTDKKDAEEVPSPNPMGGYPPMDDMM